MLFYLKVVYIVKLFDDYNITLYKKTTRYLKALVSHSFCSCSRLLNFFSSFFCICDSKKPQWDIKEFHSNWNEHYVSHARAVWVDTVITKVRKNDAVKLSGVTQVEPPGHLRPQWWENTLLIHYSMQRWQTAQLFPSCLISLSLQALSPLSHAIESISMTGILFCWIVRPGRTQMPRHSWSW